MVMDNYIRFLVFGVNHYLLKDAKCTSFALLFVFYFIEGPDYVEPKT